MHCANIALTTLVIDMVKPGRQRRVRLVPMAEDIYLELESIADEDGASVEGMLTRMAIGYLVDRKSKDK